MFDTFLTRFLQALAVVLVIACTLTGCTKEMPVPEPAACSIETIADEYLAAMLEHSPTYGTYLALPDARHDRLGDNSLEALAAWEARYDEWLSEFQCHGDLSPKALVHRVCPLINGSHLVRKAIKLSNIASCCLHTNIMLRIRPIKTHKGSKLNVVQLHHDLLKVLK